MTENIHKTTPFGLTLSESANTLRLSTDALLLSAYIKENKKAWALEMGAGSGVISLLAAKRCCFKHISAIELQPELANIMEQNIAINGFSETVTPICADIRNINPEDFKGVSVVFANPPYMKTDSGKCSPSASRQTARHETHGGVYEFCITASKILKTGGRLYLVYRPDRLETLMNALKLGGFSVKRMTFVHADRDHSPSSVLVDAVLGGKESLFITAPLFLNENGTQTKDHEYIYKHGVFPKRFQTI